MRIGLRFRLRYGSVHYESGLSRSFLVSVEAVNALGNRIVEDIKSSEPKEGILSAGGRFYRRCCASQSQLTGFVPVLGCVPREFGCEIAGTQAVVRLLITTIPPNLGKLDSELHRQSLPASVQHRPAALSFATSHRLPSPTDKLYTAA